WVRGEVARGGGGGGGGGGEGGAVGRERGRGHLGAVGAPLPPARAGRDVPQRERAVGRADEGERRVGRQRQRGGGADAQRRLADGEDARVLHAETLAGEHGLRRRQTARLRRRERPVAGVDRRQRA